MAKGIRYTGEFMSIAGSRYRAEIWQEGFTGKPVELTFPYETPVSIEWAEVDKLEPVMSSAATLMVVSETDRQFVNLYTTQAGSTRLDIYRNNKLYWSGMLDPEIYEEPFSRERDYEVSLTFSDFALLDRIAFEQTGTDNRQRIKLRTVLDMAVKQSGINTGADWQTFLSTTTSAGASLLDGVYVSEDNFFDEDGEPMTLREVLEGVLRPFGLQMVQKDGRINLYDLHALSEGLQPRRVRWCLADSALGVDKTYNNCELTYSPYMSNNLVDASIEPDMIKDTACTTHRVNVDYSDQNYPGFDMLLHPLSLRQRKFRVLDAFNQTKFFKIKPIFSGDSEAGVAVVFDTRTGHKTYAQQCSRVLNAGLPSVTIEMHDRPYVFVDPALRGNYLLNLKIEALVDVRYNPFEDASKDNEEGWWKDFQKRCHYGYIPFRLVLRNDQGRALYHYDNSTVVNTPLLSFMVYTTGRKWEPGEGTWGNAYAAYYDKEDRSKKAGWGGWKTNRPVMGYTLLLPSIFDKMFDGEYIPMPPTSGWLELSIGNTFRTIEPNVDISTIHWFLLKKVELKLTTPYGKELEKSDIVLRAWVEKSARETLKLDTVCGTLPDGAHPTARGQFFTAAGGVITAFRRAGVTDKVERLLLGTVYSQFHGRKKKLSGTADLVNKFSTLTDEHETGRFMVVSEVQNLLRDESNLTMIEIVTDNYTGVPYNEE